MRKDLSPAESAEFRRKYLRMGVNQLIGYCIVEVFALTARGMNLIGTNYSFILMLALVVNTGVGFFLIIIYVKRSYSSYAENISFFSQLVFYLITLSCAVYLADNLRFITLVCALIALAIELPFITPVQSLFITGVSIISYIGVSYFAITYCGQAGTFWKELFVALSFLAPMSFISYIAVQIRNQKKEIEADKHSLELLNIDLKAAQDRSELEIGLAGYVQTTLFHREPPRTVGWDIALVFKPAYSVSGDFYDFYYDNDKLKGLSIFDVSGHGVAAGLVTMIARPILYRIFTSGEDMSLNEIVSTAGKTFFREIENIDSFITGIVLRFDDHFVEYVNIAHHDILIKKASSGAVKAVVPENRDFRSVPMGKMFGTPSFKTVRFPIENGDILCLYTDGILEGKNHERTRFGRERLMEHISNAPGETSREILDFILKGFRDFIGGADLDDDYVVILAKKKF